MNATQDITTFIDRALARENNNFPKVLNEVAKGFEKHGFFSKSGWSQILTTNFIDQTVGDVAMDTSSESYEFPATVLQIADNRQSSIKLEHDYATVLQVVNISFADNCQSEKERLDDNFKIEICGSEDNELSVIVLFIDDDDADNQPIQTESNDAELLAKSTSDVLENSHDNAVIPESRPTKRNQMTSFSSEGNSDDEENILVPLRFRTPSPIFVSRNENVKIKVENDMTNAVDHRKDCETTRQGKLKFLDNLTGTDWTRICAKANCQSSKESHVKFVSAFNKYNQTQIVANAPSSIAVEKAVRSSKARNASKNHVEPKQRVPENLTASTKLATEQTLRQIQYISSQKDLLTTVPSSSSNIALSRLTGGTVAAQRDSTIPELIASPSSTPSNCEYYENQPTGIRDDMGAYSQELLTTTSHLSNKNHLADLPANLMRCKIVLYPGAGDHCDSNMNDKMKKDADAENSAIKRFCCDICGKKFTGKANIKQHMVIHTGVKPHTCRVCERSFSFHSDLRRHLSIHTGERRYVCGICSKAFNQSANLFQHKRIHTGVKKYVCDICSKAFHQSGNLLRHKRIHSVERSYVCDTCPKAFRSSSDLSWHKKIHTGERQYFCDTCPKSFGSSSDLSRHKRIHTGERQYFCDTCPKSFGSSSDLSRHKRIHTGERPYVCDTCFKAFNRSYSLLLHKKIHFGVKVFSCAHCGKSYIEKGDLEKHLDKCFKEHHFQDRFEDHSKGQSNIK